MATKKKKKTATETNVAHHTPLSFNPRSIAVKMTKLCQHRYSRKFGDSGKICSGFGRFHFGLICSNDRRSKKNNNNSEKTSLSCHLTDSIC